MLPDTAGKGEAYVFGTVIGFHGKSCKPFE